MFKTPLLAMVMCCSWASFAFAEDYLLRVDVIGFVDRLTSEKDQAEQTLRSVEVVVRPDSTFHTKIKTGPETVIVSGKLSSRDNGGFSLDIVYEHTVVVDTGISLPNEEGIKKPVLDTTRINTTIAIAVDESVALGGLERKSGEPSNPEKHSKTRLALALTKHTPHRD